jgi:hypothetical protein
MCWFNGRKSPTYFQVVTMVSACNKFRVLLTLTFSGIQESYIVVAIIMCLNSYSN